MTVSFVRAPGVKRRPKSWSALVKEMKEMVSI
jgi:hypothetical protein